MKKPIVILVILLILLNTFATFGQAATQTDQWCPEFGQLESARGALWLNMYDTVTLNAEGLERLQNLDTSVGLQASYGDRSTDEDDHWVGAPNDLQPYITMTVETSNGKRWLGFSESPSEPELIVGIALNSRTISGEGDQRGMHDICAIFVTTRSEVEAIWNERIVD